MGTFTAKNKMYAPTHDINDDPPELKVKRTETIESLDSQKGWKRLINAVKNKLFK